jgi:hypothetical protein
MQNNKEFVLIAEGYYSSADEAFNALCEPFIEDFVEETGSFKTHNYEDIAPVGGVSLNDLEIVSLDDGVFEISLRSSQKVLNRQKAEQLAENLERQLVFDSISIEPLED